MIGGCLAKLTLPPLAACSRLTPRPAEPTADLSAE